jgi:prevent-host-death family protein
VTVSVGIRELRGNLREYLDRVRQGDEVIVTDRGKPVALIRPPEGQRTLERLVAEGRVTLPTLPKAPIRLEDLPVVEGNAVSDFVIEQRRTDS